MASVKPTARRKPLLPGFDSYRGRYLYVTLLLLGTLSAAGLFGYKHVSQLSAQNLQNIRDRGQATALLQDALGQLQQLQQAMGQYLLTPPRTTPEALDDINARLAGSLEQLRGAPWIRQQQQLMVLSNAAWWNLQQLDQLLQQLIQLRAARHHWLPAVSRIEESMNPARLEVQGILRELLAETDELEHNAETASLRELLLLMQQHWIQGIAEMRLLIANRFGVFNDDAMGGIAGREHNIRIYMGSYREELQTLTDYAQRGALGFLGAPRTERLRTVLDQWERDLDLALTDLTGEGWRPDLALVQEEIEPVTEILEQRLSSLRLELDIESARNITDLTEISRRLIGFAALLILAGGLFAAAAYLMFDRMLLRPIRQTTLALKQEALGEQATEPPSALAAETRDLVDAFAEMRQQVRRRQNHLDHLAHHDTLTGLPNRLLFHDRLQHALALSQRDASINAVLLLDLDRFKKINDTLGHAAGDQLLKLAAERLQALVRTSDTVARLGGDEFAILMERMGDRNDITRLAEKIIRALERPFDVEGRQLHISTCIGLAMTPTDGNDPDALTRAADTAMYAAKQAGSGCFRFFTGEMSRQANAYMELETALRGAITEQSFALHYQPIVSAYTRELHGLEALLRWSHPDTGPMSPDLFVPVLDDMGQLGEVSRWILHQISTQQRRFARHGNALTVSVNLTARLLYDASFSAHLLAALRAGRLAPTQLIVEITEDSLTQDLDAAERVLHELKQLGVRIALDDFGTGQSSLNHLRRFPFDLVKIDREFVRDLPDDFSNVRLVQAVIELSRAFGMQVVAEGVETEAQEQLLRSMGCDYLQGYRISRPAALEALGPFLPAAPTQPAAHGQT
jgi:diguanylate cyclase (GGDEF)-like protein